jgi:hypothetical protein
VINFLDLSWLKLSVDTREDLDRVVKEYEKIQSNCAEAERIFGKGNVHRY